MKVNVLSASKVVAEIEASEVNVPGSQGYMGILENHAPMIAEMGAGTLAVTGTQGTDRYYVSGGFVEVTDSDVRVLVDAIESESDIDFVAAASEKEQLEKEMETTPDWDAKAKFQRQIAQLEAKLNLKQ